MKNQRVPIEEFQMPYGRYSGVKLGDLYYKDKAYLQWCQKNFPATEGVGKRIHEFMDKMNVLEKEVNQPELDLLFQ